MKKRLFITLALVLMVGIFAGAMFGCNKDKAQAYAFSNNREIYAFSIVSGLELALDNNLVGAKATQSEFDNMVDSIHSYLPSFEGFLGNTNLIVPQETQSDKAEYAKLMNVNYTDMVGNSHNYKIYYNETVPSQNNRPWEDEDDDEIETHIEGIIILNGNTYNLVGNKEIENDETEIEFQIQVDADKRIEIKQETENNEQEFEYSLYYGSNLAYSTSIGIEIKDGKIEFETEYESQNQNMELEVKQDRNNANRFYVEYEINKKEYRITIDKQLNGSDVKYTYTMDKYSTTKTA